jgi:hypothetical protein
LKRVSNQLYVYAIIDAPVELNDLIGVTHEPLSLLRGPECWLAIGWIAPPVPSPTAALLRTQDALVRTLATRVEALLPLRFGTAFENETALHLRLAHFTAARIRNALSRVRGREQMTLRVFQTPQPPPPAAPSASASPTTPTSPGPGPGTSYLAQRAAALATELSPLLQPLREALADVVREELLDTAHRPPLIGSAFHLIARGDTDRYRAAMSACPPPPGITLHVTGPSPAYAFARDALS